MKNLMNLKGVKTLNRLQQKSINGGSTCCTDECSSNSDCTVTFGKHRECQERSCLGCPTLVCVEVSGGGGIQ